MAATAEEARGLDWITAEGLAVLGLDTLWLGML